MIIDKMFPHLCRLAEFGDKINKGSKTGANVSIGDGGVLLANDMHSVIVLMEHSEFNEEVAFKSHLFPEAYSPIEIVQKDKSIDFNWKKKSVKESVNVPSCGNLFDQGRKAFKKYHKMQDTFMLPVKAFDLIDDNIHVLRIKRNKAGIVFEQMTTNGDEIFRHEIPLKASGGLMAHASNDEIEEVETIVPTIEFKTLGMLTDESVIELCFEKDGGKIFGNVSMGAVTTKIIVTEMKYKR